MRPTYLHQRYLPAPLPRTTLPFLEQPLSHLAIDGWLIGNHTDAYRQDVLVPGYLDLGDVPQDQVLCTVVMAVGKVSVRPSVIINER
jgi:hypothetical protein